MNRRIGDKDTASCLGGLCSLYLYFCVCISVFVFVCLYWCVCICVCLCLYLCLYLCVCICVFVFGPVNRRRGHTFQPGGSLLPYGPLANAIARSMCTLLGDIYRIQR